MSSPSSLTLDVLLAYHSHVSTLLEYLIQIIQVEATADKADILLRADDNEAYRNLLLGSCVAVSEGSYRGSAFYKIAPPLRTMVDVRTELVGEDTGKSDLATGDRQSTGATVLQVS